MKQEIKKTDNNEERAVRINKFLSEAGVCSRRQADRLIEEGKVTVDGLAAVAGTKVLPGQTVKVSGQIVKKKKQIIIAFNKPCGIECTSSKDVPDNIIDYINFHERIYTVGRLDKNSSGLILLTNNGDLANSISKSVNGHEKEYIVRVDRPFNDDFLKRMSDGIYLEELHVKTKKCKIKRLDKYTFNIILTQGLNRQIRRMCSSLGYNVVSLKRIRVMNIILGDLKEGRYRYVNENEMNTMLKELEK